MGEIQLMPITQDYVMIQEPREYYLRMPTWTTWNEVRLGMFFTMIPTGNFSTFCSAETITTASYLDWLCWGVKDSSSNMPGTAGAQFVGLGWAVTNPQTSTLTSNSAGAGAISAGSGTHRTGLSVNGATVISAVSDMAITWDFPIYSAGGGASGYSGIIVMKLVVNNVGLSNQSVTISTFRSGVATTTDVSLANLRTQVFNSTYANPVTVNWFSGGSALPMPCGWYLRLPFNNNRIRISAMDMFKIN